MSSPSQKDAIAPGRALDEEKVKEFMDSTLLSIVDDLSKSDGRPSVTLKRRSRRTLYSLNAETGALEMDGRGAETIVTYSWPGKTPIEAWRFGKMRSGDCLADISSCIDHIADMFRMNPTRRRSTNSRPDL